MYLVVSRYLNEKKIAAFLLPMPILFGKEV